MILVFGTILMDLRLVLEKAQTGTNALFASEYDVGVGGHAALHALAAAKAGAKTALIGKIGDDHYGKNILLRLRQRGVITSGVGRNEGTTTGSIITLGRKNPQTIIASGASTGADPEQIPDEIIKDGAIILLQDELTAAQNIPVINRARTKDVTLIMTRSGTTDWSPYKDIKFDYVIARGEDAGTFSVQKKNENPQIIKMPVLETLKVVDHTCTLDAFCGTFAAGLLEKKSEAIAIHHASVAAMLTACRKGGHTSLPYPDAVKDTIKLLEEKN